jgi:RNA polymerase sigma factor (sigma-70 family)
MSDEVILEEIRSGKKEAIEVLYRTYRVKFIRVMTATHTHDVSWATDIYRVAISIVYENVMNGKLASLIHDNSLWNYIFKTGVYLYKDDHRHQKKTAELTEDVSDSYTDTQHESEELQQRARQEEEKVKHLRLMQQAIDLLGEPCSKLLELYYFEDKSMVEIAEEMDYNNSDTTKNQKYKCIKRLRKIFNDISKDNQ